MVRLRGPRPRKCRNPPDEFRTGVVVVDDPEVDQEFAAAGRRDILRPSRAVDQGQWDLELDDVTIGSAGGADLPIGVGEVTRMGLLVPPRIGDELEPLTITHTGSLMSGIGHLVAVDEDFNAVIKVGLVWTRFRRHRRTGRVSGTPERATGRCKPYEPDAQVVGRLGARLAPGPEASGVGVAIERGIDARSVLAGCDPSVGDRARGRNGASIVKEAGGRRPG